MDATPAFGLQPPSLLSAIRFFPRLQREWLVGGSRSGLSHRIEVQRAEQDVPFHLLAVWTSATSIVDNHQFANGRC